MAPFLADWTAHPVADAHLESCVRWWISSLVADDSPFTGWDDDAQDATVTELQTWLARHAPPRLRARNEPRLATEAELLALPYDDRWAHPYWTNPAATS